MNHVLRPSDTPADEREARLRSALENWLATNQERPVSAGIVLASIVESVLASPPFAPEQNGYVQVIAVEKLLCAKLGRTWSPAGMSIESLINDLAAPIASTAEPVAWISVEDRLPQEGRDVLAFFRYPSSGKGRVVKAMHAPKFKISEDDYGEFLSDGGEYDEATDMTYWPEGWYETFEEGETSWQLSHGPTHWMPLPSGPGATPTASTDTPPVPKRTKEDGEAYAGQIADTPQRQSGSSAVSLATSDPEGHRQAIADHEAERSIPVVAWEDVHCPGDFYRRKPEGPICRPLVYGDAAPPPQEDEARDAALTDEQVTRFWNSECWRHHRKGDYRLFAHELKLALSGRKAQDEGQGIMSGLPTVEIVKVYPTRIWSDKDFFGTVHIWMQHEGCKPFEFIQMNYDHRYTSNGHQHDLTQKILKLLGVEP